jgi:hypothetical protein
VTCVYLSQNLFFGIPTLIRRQFNYVIILKLSGARDLKQIILNYSLGLDSNQIIKLYRPLKEKFHFVNLGGKELKRKQDFFHNYGF